MSQTGGKKRFARNWAIMASAFGLWGALVLLFGAPLALTNRISWLEAVSFGASFWALWLLFLPVVVGLSLRFPIERRRIFVRLGIHLLACVAVVGINRVMFRAVSRAFPLPQPVEMTERAPGAVPDGTGRPGQRSAPLAPRPSLPPRRSLDLVGPPDTHVVFLGLRAALDVVIYWSLVGACAAFINLRKVQLRERRSAELETSLMNARLQALRMQINPHFLFNTLNSIAALIYVNPRAADEMLADLSELLRRSLNSMEEQETSVGTELEFINSYISIEQKRLGERLQVEQRVPEELLRARVPALLLQPLVENAIRHGIESKRGTGIIVLEAKREGRRLHLMIQDNGRGLAEAKGADFEGFGVGLSNTRARLQALYGKEQSFTLAGSGSQGCRVDIHLPLRPDPTMDANVSSNPVA